MIPVCNEEHVLYVNFWLGRISVTTLHHIHVTVPAAKLPKSNVSKAAIVAVNTNKTPNYFEELTADMLNWLLWTKKDNTHLCDPETFGCWSSFSAWLRAMTLSPRAKATKALQARMEHLDTRAQLLTTPRLNNDRCVGRTDTAIKMRQYSTDDVPQVFNLLLPERRWRSSGQDFISLLPLPTMAKTRTDYLGHQFNCKVIRL